MFHVSHWWGKDESNLPSEHFDEVISELADADNEHPDCCLTHESGWSLSYSKNGRLTFENVETDEDAPRHMKCIAPAQVVELWRHLADGNVEHVKAQEWQPGNG
jgi:hypothetical protein